MKQRKKPVPINNSPEQLKSELMNAIAKGKFKPGERLIEQQLCKLFNVKRSRIREVLRKLENEGFVRITKNVGAFVTEITLRDIEEIHDILCVLDGLSVRIATQYISPKQIEDVEKIIIKMENSDNPVELVEYNTMFHALITSYCENKNLIKLAENLRVKINLFSFRNFTTQAQRSASLSDHKMIVAALKKGDPEEAEAVMRKHVTEAKYRLTKYMSRTL